MASNGKLPASALASIGGGFFLAVKAAPYFLAMMAAMVAAGVGRPTLNWAYRTYAEQVAMRKKHGTGAAIAGTSNHGWGLSVDMNLTARQLAWLRKNARMFGFVEDVRNESWHWTFKVTPTIALSTPSKPTTTPAPNIPTPAPTPEEADDDMKDLILGVQLADKRLIVQNLADHTYYDVPNVTQWAYLKALGIKLVNGPQPTSVIAGFRKI